MSSPVTQAQQTSLRASPAVSSGWATDVNGRLLPRNSLLRNLSPSDYDCIYPFLEAVTLKTRGVLQEPQRTIKTVDFIESGIVSLMTLASGSIFETAIVDHHGVVGFSVALGASTSVYRSVVLAAGTALRIPVARLQHCMDERPQIREHLLRYVHSFMVQSAQKALCSVRHELDGRLASWLCLVCDSLDRNVLAITHDQLSALLGSRRASVTETLVRFEEQGLVEKMRGVILVRDRELLRKKACCCYGRHSDAYQCRESLTLV